MNLRTTLKSLLVLLIVFSQVSCHSSPKKSEAEQIVDSFKAKLDTDIQSHKNRTDVWAVSGSASQAGWYKAQIELPTTYTVNVVKTESLVSPYLGTAELVVTSHNTYLQDSKEAALAATQFKDTTEIKHRLTYAYQNGTWVIKSEQCFQYDGDAEAHVWVDCSPTSNGPYALIITTP
jgi:hypothetical protein